MRRRGFLAGLLALPLAPFVKPTPCASPFALEAHIKQAAAALAASIDARCVQQLTFHPDAFCLRMGDVVTFGDDPFRITGDVASEAAL